MLHNVCQEMTRENVSDFLFLCQNKIPRAKCEEIREPCNLFCALEQLKIVGPDNLRFLSSVLSEIRRQDLAQKVKEHCRHTSDSRVGQVSASNGTTLMSDTWPESSNQVVSYRSACLEPDDAEPLSQINPLTFEGLTEDNHEELINRRIPADNDRDMPCYDMDNVDMDKNPRGNDVAFSITVYYSCPDKSIFSVSHFGSKWVLLKSGASGLLPSSSPGSVTTGEILFGYVWPTYEMKEFDDKWHNNLVSI